MALADSNYRFISMDDGAKGAEGDANIFSRSELGRMIKTDDAHLNLPPDAVVGCEPLILSSLFLQEPFAFSLNTCSFRARLPLLPARTFSLLLFFYFIKRNDRLFVSII